MDEDTLAEARDINRLLIELSTVRINLGHAGVVIPLSMDPTLTRLANLLENLVFRLAKQDAKANPETADAR